MLRRLPLTLIALSFLSFPAFAVNNVSVKLHNGAEITVDRDQPLDINKITLDVIRSMPTTGGKYDNPGSGKAIGEALKFDKEKGRISVNVERLNAAGICSTCTYAVQLMVMQVVKD